MQTLTDAMLVIISNMRNISALHMHADRGTAQSIWYGLSTNQQMFFRITFTITTFHVIGRLLRNADSARDLGLLVVAVLWICRSFLFRTLVKTLLGPSCLYIIATLSVQFSAAYVAELVGPGSSHKRKEAKSPFPKPMIFPSKTTHARLFPNKHSFAYSYLLVGVPVSCEGNAKVLPRESRTFGKTAWFSVNAEDYLARGTHIQGLSGKLGDYLTSQGVPKSRYSYAYLVTAPRFLGFSFNPVSFWYLFGPTGSLSTMILEVNNTFDERRMYLMEHVKTSEDPDETTFSSSWTKDFHVSPFNDRKGSYSLTAKDPSAFILDNNIVLRDDEGNAKLVARIFSTQPGIDPSAMTTFESWTFLAKWWWVGFMTNPRILREARVLWVKKLKVFYRPEVKRSSIGRTAHAIEARLEPYFRAFLTQLSLDSQDPVTISYNPAAGQNTGKAIELQACPKPNLQCASRSVAIDVLTPAFYAELARSGSIEAALERFCFNADDDEAFLWVSDHDLLQQLLRGATTRRSNNSSASQMYYLRQGFVSWLRDRTTKNSDASCLASDPRGTERQSWNRSPGFDSFVRRSQSLGAYRAYLRYARILLFADLLAFGMLWLLSLYKYCIQVMLALRIGYLCVDNLDSSILLSLSSLTMLFHALHIIVPGIKPL